MQLDFSRVDELNTHITKEEILSKISPKDIFEFYIGHSINQNDWINSPFRKERNPSFSFKFYSDSHVLAKDWGTGEKYDCFSFVSKLYNLSFYETLKVVSENFCLKTDKPIIKSVPAEIITVKKKKLLQVQTKPFSKIDIDYWKQYNISLEVLVYYNVFSCKYVWLDGNLIYQNTSGQPIYAYKFTSYKSTSYKIYRPLSEKKGKWLFSGTVSDIEGYDQLPLHGDLLIITKSMKDVMCYHTLGYDAISLQGENNPIDPIIFETISKRFKRILINFDNDEAGIIGADKLVTKFGLESFIIPEDLESKDLSDTIKKYGIQFTNELLNSII